MCDDPLIVLLHDALTNQEIELMTKTVLNSLETATVVDDSVKDGSGSRVAIERNQAHGWLFEQDHPFLHQLSLKTGKLVSYIQKYCIKSDFLKVTSTKIYLAIYDIGKMVGFEVAQSHDERATMNAEAWQLGLYGPGGHYLPHFDAFDNHLLPHDVRNHEGTWVGNR